MTADVDGTFTACPTLTCASRAPPCSPGPTTRLGQPSTCVSLTSKGLVTFDLRDRRGASPCSTLPSTFRLTDDTVTFALTVNGAAHVVDRAGPPHRADLDDDLIASECQRRGGRIPAAGTRTAASTRVTSARDAGGGSRRRRRRPGGARRRRRRRCRRRPRARSTARGPSRAGRGRRRRGRSGRRPGLVPGRDAGPPVEHGELAVGDDDLDRTARSGRTWRRCR